MDLQRTPTQRKLCGSPLHFTEFVGTRWKATSRFQYLTLEKYHDLTDSHKASQCKFKATIKTT